MHTRIKSNHSSQDFHFSLMTLFKSIYWKHLKKPSPLAQPPPTGIFPHRNESKCEKCIFRLWSLWTSTINDDFNSMDCKWALCRIHLNKYSRKNVCDWLTHSSGSSSTRCDSDGSSEFSELETVLSELVLLRALLQDSSNSFLEKRQ